MAEKGHHHIPEKIQEGLQWREKMGNREIMWGVGGKTVKELKFFPFNRLNIYTTQMTLM